MDFGRKYMNRIFVYTSVFMCIYLTFTIFFALDYFELVDFNFPVILVFLVTYDIIFVLGTTLAIFNVGAMINQQYVEDKQMLIKMKQSVLFLIDHLQELKEESKTFANPLLKLYA
mmetsp:Transcript_10319/g.10296  ORF Transcript_10319/g.10296 Transcript_10319/m.10296 type:complete len:115 (-) Transcript_10319:337-681(-)